MAERVSGSHGPCPQPLRGQGPDNRHWDDYDKTYGHELDGSLFTSAEGYFGPGEKIGLPFWKAPFHQEFDGRVPVFTAEQLLRYSGVAREFWNHLSAKGWDVSGAGVPARRFFAYIIDEPGVWTHAPPATCESIRRRSTPAQAKARST